MSRKHQWFTAVAFISLVSIPGCDFARNHTQYDRERDMSVQDYKDALAPRDMVFKDVEEDNDIPELDSYVSDPSDSLQAMPLVSVFADQNVPLREVLYYLAMEAGFDLELDPRIQGAIIMTATDKPFDVVIERISYMAGLRYKLEDDTLRVELDTPYTKNYPVDFLNIVRKNKSDISADISVVSGDGADTGSNYSISNESEADFWTEMDDNIKQILESNAGINVLRTNSDPSITAAERNIQRVETISSDELIDEDFEEGMLPERNAANNEGPSAVLRVQTLPVGSLDVDSNAVDYKPTYTINRQAAIISIYASEKSHKKVDEYLEQVRKIVTAQVLIEAKVLEVSLSDQYSTGIDWGAIDLGSNVLLDTESVNAVGAIASSGGLNLLIEGNDISAFANALSTFGTVRALSSPRLTVLNNQSAVLNVATNTVYFEIDAEDEEDADTGDTSLTLDSEVRSVPEGVLIFVQPFVNVETDEITMAVRPTVTRITQRVLDPVIEIIKEANGLGGDAIKSEVPEVNVQEIDSIVKMNSGEVMVMGGLIQDNLTTNRNGVPGLGEMPVLGGLFSQQSDTVEKTELVIFIRAQVITPNKTIHQTDKDLYKLFSRDRRPLKL